MTSIPKRHHYIPQFFLKKFSVDGQNVWLFDRYKKEYRNQSTRKIASENKFYTCEVKGKEENLEDLLSKVEGFAKPILEKLTSKQEITMQAKADFAMFASIMKVRVPDFKKKTEEAGEKMYKKINKIMFSNDGHIEQMLIEQNIKLSKKKLKDLIDFARDGRRYYVEFPANYWLGMMLKLSLEVARLFIDMDWKVFHFDKKYALITSDNPVVLVPPDDYDPNSIYGVGLITRGARKIFSLAPNTCLIITDLNKNPTIQHVNIKDKDVFRSINYVTAGNSDRFVYSPEKGKLEKIVKDTKVDEFIRTERVYVG